MIRDSEFGVRDSGFGVRDSGFRTFGDNGGWITRPRTAVARYVQLAQTVPTRAGVVSFRTLRSFGRWWPRWKLLNEESGVTMSARAVTALIAFCAGLVSIVGCQQPTFRHQLHERARQRLLARIREEQATQARFEKLGPGTPSAAVLKEFGSPSTTSSCRNSHECWFYDISGQTYFVCFDDHATVTCEGRASIFGQNARGH